MNNEETILDPQYAAETNANKSNEVPQAPVENKAEVKSASKKENKKSNGMMGNVAAAAAGVAVGAAGTLYAANAMAADMPDEEMQDEAPTEEVAPQNASAEHTVTPKQSATSAKHTSANEPAVEVVETGQVDVDGDGTLDTVAHVRVDGQDMLLADIDHDGNADVAMADANGNGQLDEGELVDVSAHQIGMPGVEEAGGAMYASQSIEDDEVDVRILSVGQTDLNDDGLPENAAVLDIEGNEVLMVDIDLDNTADALIADFNNDGQIQEDEIADISDQNIEMPMSDDSDGDLYQAADMDSDCDDAGDYDLYEA